MKKIATAIVIIFSFLSSANGNPATNAEKACMTRYITMLSSEAGRTTKENQTQIQRETLIAGMLAFTYFRESDPAVAETIRSTIIRLYRQAGGGDINDEIKKFSEELKAVKKEDRQGFLEIVGFDSTESASWASQLSEGNYKEFTTWLKNGTPR